MKYLRHFTTYGVVSSAPKKYQICHQCFIQRYLIVFFYYISFQVCEKNIIHKEKKK